MTKRTNEVVRVVSVGFNARGLVYVVLEGSLLLDWGTIRERLESKLSIAERMMQHIKWYEPTVVVVEDAQGIQRRGLRSRLIAEELCSKIEALGISVLLASPDDGRHTLNRLGHRIVFKADLVPVLLEYYPQLEASAPPPRKAWMGDDHRMALFVALALALWGLDRTT